MKINSLKKSIIKKATIAFALASLSISTAQATDFIYESPSDDIRVEYASENSGNIRVSAGARLGFYQSTLGYSGGSFEVVVTHGGVFMLARSTLNASNIFTHDAGGIYIDYSDVFVGYAGVFDESSGSIYNLNASKLISEGGIAVGAINADYGSYVEAEYGVQLSSLHLTDGSILKTNTQAYIGAAVLSGGALIDFTITTKSEYNSIYFESLIVDSPATIQLGFNDSFIGTIVDAGDRSFNFSIYDYIIFETTITGSEYLDFCVAGSSETYTWNLVDLGGGEYVLADISVIPEPSTYAAIFGVLSFALAIYRRRK